MMKSKRITIALTFGNLEGIGPEVSLLGLSKIKTGRHSILIIGNERLARFLIDKFSLPLNITWLTERTVKNGIDSPGLYFFDPLPCPYNFTRGRFNPDLAKYPVAYLETALDFIHDKKIQGITTGPIDKNIFKALSLPFRGHTDYLQSKSGSHDVMMIFVSRKLRIGLATIHVPLKSVPQSITPVLLEKRIRLFSLFLKQYTNKSHPSIAICALNPHAGDGGLIGDEESRIIEPFIKKNRDQYTIYGPFPADTLFIPRMRESYDGILALYHDQAMIPIKLIDFYSAVNISFGLPFVRTSPAHGTGYDLVDGNGLSDRSMVNAILTALNLLKKGITGVQDT